MRFFLKTSLLLMLGVVFSVQAFAAASVSITALRSWRAPDNTRIVLDLSGPVKYRLNEDSTPARLIVDIEDVQLQGPLAMPALSGPLKSLRFEKNGPGQRLVIETALELMPKIFQLPPNEKYGQRLVLDLYEKNTSAPAGVTPSLTPAPAITAEKSPAQKSAPSTPALSKLDDAAAALRALGGVPAPTPATAPATTPVAAPVAMPVTKPMAKMPATEKILTDKKALEKPAEIEVGKSGEPVQEKFDNKRYRNIVVAIDAGHGGEDPGAIGLKGSHEKNITLAIARELEAQLQSEPGITAVLTRSGDYFIPLQDRRRIARYQHKADIFVSIHADAAENRSAHGASVFALSLKGAGTATSRFASMLAERENRSDLIGGAAIEKDDVLRNVLADMVVAGSLDHSLHMARNIIGNLDAVGSLHSRNVEQAGFAVLKEPGMVSVLVETGFVSNPDEEERLNSKSYQHEVARAVFKGVRRYCVQYPAPGTYFAWLSERGRDKPVLLAANSKKSSGNVKADAVKVESEKTVTEKTVSEKNVLEKAVPEKAVPEKEGVVKTATVKALPASQDVVKSRKEKEADVVVMTRAAAARPLAAKPSTSNFSSHRVSRGENLSELAAQYQVSMNVLRELNRLQDDNVKIGQVLKIPAR